MFRSESAISWQRWAESVPKKDFTLRCGAKKARLGMLLAGRVFPFTEHQSYFAEQIIPELDGPRRFIGPIALTKKIRFLSAAKCTVVTSLVPETSWLVARESLACGTPVVAFRRGALPEAIDSGRTGYIVDDERDLPDAIRACDRIDARHCREAAEERFSAAEMVNHYIRAYRGIVEGEGQGSYRAA